MTSTAPISGRRILAFWVPMAFTWLMMALEGPYLAAVIARLPDPRPNLAAFGIAFAFAIIAESPVIMILSASTALTTGPESYRKLRRFTYVLNGAVTAAMMLMLLTPAFGALARVGLRLPDDIAELTRTSLLLLLPWPAAIGYRRFFQGLMIRAGQTRRIAYGTVTRLTTMSATGFALASYSDWPGAWVGGAALTAGVLAEAVFTRWTARPAVRRVLAVKVAGNEEEPGSSSADGQGLSYSAITKFYYPLALTSMIGLAAHPIVTFFMGQARFPIASLAVLPVVNSLTFIFRAAGLSFQEVAIALLARGPVNFVPVRRFARGLAVVASGGLAMIAFTPLGDVWFGGISGLDAELVEFARVPTRILALLPLLSVVLAFQRATLVHARTTAAITRATAAELIGIVALLLLAIFGMDMVGTTAAALAMIGGRLAGNLSLIGPCARARAGSG